MDTALNQLVKIQTDRMDNSIKNAELTFPVTAESFAAYQESLLRRRLSKSERYGISEWIPVINQFYADGQNGDREALKDGVAYLDGLIAEGKYSPAIVKFVKCMRVWICTAWKCGSDEVAVPEQEEVTCGGCDCQPGKVSL